jgi:hypothetical protein
MEAEKQAIASFREPEITGLAFQELSVLPAVPVRNNNIAEPPFPVVSAFFVRTKKILQTE